MKLSHTNGVLHEQSPAMEHFQQIFEQLVASVATVVVTSPHNIRLALLGLFAQGHVLLEDLPGVGKTLLAKTIAASIDGQFSRIQFTSDLLPSDITGTSVFDMQHQTFEFVPGPIFANIVLADELNRAGPRTQSALLEAMAEGQVSADGNVKLLPRPFMVIATQNMIESYGTFPLPNSQLDRFMVSMRLGLPTPEQEMEILGRFEHGLPQVSPLLTPAEVVQMQELVMGVKAARPVQQYIVNLAAASRECSYLSHGVSPRASASLLRACQGWAAFQGRSFVIPEDVQALAPQVWGQRVMVGHDEGIQSGQEAIARLLQSVPVPL
ncbi:MAG: MoxR family ATPase [Chloroflexi bacterium]|nr:MoxR family ATPase [Chloroflexota bacterium]MDA1219135.1 MoxR family ATPase [Chloroflexota bacterium]